MPGCLLIHRTLRSVAILVARAKNFNFVCVGGALQQAEPSQHIQCSHKANPSECKLKKKYKEENIIEGY